MSKESFWYIFSRFFLLCLRALQVGVVLGIILIIIGFFRLSIQPVNVDFLVPQFEKYLLPKEAKLTLSVESVYLKTGIHEDGLLHIDVSGFSVLRSDGTIIADAPKMTMSYGLWNVLTFNYLPNVVNIQKPVIQGIIDKTGDFYIQKKRLKPEQKQDKQPVLESVVLSTDMAVSMAAPLALSKDKPSIVDENADKNIDNILKQIHAEDVDKIIRYLLQFKQMEIEDASLVLDDRYLNREFSISKINILFDKKSRYIHELKGQGVIYSQDTSMDVGFEASLNRKTKQVPFDISFGRVNLSKFSDFIPVLASDNLLIKGNIIGRFDFLKNRFDFQKSLVDLSFKIETEQSGKISLPSPLTNDYHIRSALIQGAFTPDLSSLNIDDSVVILEDGPIADVTVDIKGIDRFLETLNPDFLKAQLNAHITGVRMEQIPSVWPQALGPDAHAWVARNLKKGHISQADFTLYFKGVELIDLFGRCFVEGTSVRYVEQMPIVENVSGEVLLYPDKVEIFADNGNIGSLRLQKANVYLTKLTSPVSQAEIEIKAKGPIQEALNVIEAKPLEFPQMFGLKSSQTGGTGNVSLILKFPLVESLNLQQVQVDVQAALADAVFSVPETSLSLTNGMFQLNVNNQKLVLNGHASLDKIPISLNWTENFQAHKQTDIQSKYDISSDVKASFLTKWIPNILKYAKGDMAVRAYLTKEVSGKQVFDIKSDIQKMSIHLYPISTVKENNIPAEISINGIIDPSKSKPNFSFHFVSADKKIPIDIQGDIDFTNGFSLNLNRVSAPDNRFSGYLAIDKNKNAIIQLKGASLNATSVFKMAENDIAQNQSEQKSSQTGSGWKNIDVDIRLNKLLVAPDLPLKNIEIKAVRLKGVWQEIHTFISAAKPFSIQYAADNKQLKIQTDDFGDLLTRLNVTNRLSGGYLSGEAVQSDAGGFSGTLSVRRFNYLDPGFFVQAVTILGIVNAITGSELSFKRAVIPFEIDSDAPVLKIQNGYAFGTTLGLTVKGLIDVNRIHLTGSVLPAYIINSLLGRIPLIGGLFRDGDGGGLVGARYTISGTPFKPEISFNPLASMAPGALGGLFY